MVMVLALLPLGHLAHCATITWNNPVGTIGVFAD